jgi:hypothetical protein
VTDNEKTHLNPPDSLCRRMNEMSNKRSGRIRGFKRSYHMNSVGCMNNAGGPFQTWRIASFNTTRASQVPPPVLGMCQYPIHAKYGHEDASAMLSLVRIHGEAPHHFPCWVDLLAGTVQGVRTQGNRRPACVVKRSSKHGSSLLGKPPGRQTQNCRILERSVGIVG